MSTPPTRKRGRPPADPNPEPEQSTSTGNKKRKLNTYSTKGNNRAKRTGFLGRFVQRVDRFINGEDLNGNDEGTSRSTSVVEEERAVNDDTNGVSAEEEEAEEDELAAITDEEENAHTKAGRLRAPKLSTNSSPAPKKRGRGRPRKDTTVANGNSARKRKLEASPEPEEDNDEEENVEEEVEEEVPVKSTGKLKRVKRFALRDARKTRDRDTSNDEEEDAHSVSVSKGKESSTRGKRQTRHQLNVDTNGVQPKSILSAAKPQRGRPRKTVGFEVGKASELDLGFKDIPDTIKSTRQVSNATKTKGKAADKPTASKIANEKEAKGTSKAGSKQPVEEDSEEESDSEEEDDTPCAMCQGTESEEHNEIVFCEGCDLAYHQECYGIEVIPEDDWFCRECAPKEQPGEDEDQDDDNDEDEDEEEEGEDEDEEAEEDEDDELGGDLDESNGTLLQKQTHGIPNFAHHLHVMQSLLLQKLSGQRRMKLRGLDEEFSKVYQVVEQTVLAGESNSMLVIGARGSGKTTLVETVLSDLSAEHRENFHIVKLNGFIHTDDKLALREIWRQLGREMDLDEELTGKTTRHADTLASLLALLSHPSELSETDPSQTSKSVIFILDEFDLFATHSRQTLLYNLFDIAQARKAPIAVLGLTTRIDVVEALEKRVKSRFSHRYVHLSLPRTLLAFWDICKEGLVANEDQIEALEPDVDVDGWSEFQDYWNSMIENLYTEDESFEHHLQSHFYRTKSIPSFLTTCLLPIASLTPANLPLTGSSFHPSSIPNTSTSKQKLNSSSINHINSLSLLPPDSKLNIIPTLPLLALTLLISAARLDIIHDTETCNFEMAYDEYTSIATRHKIQNTNTTSSNINMNSPLGMSGGVGMISVTGTKIWGREVALQAWERLAECGLLVGGVGGVGGEGKGTRMWRIDVGLEEIGGCVDGLGEVYRKWCREI